MLAASPLVLDMANHVRGGDGTVDSIVARVAGGNVELLVGDPGAETLHQSVPVADVLSLSILGSSDDDRIRVEGHLGFNVTIDGRGAHAQGDTLVGADVASTWIVYGTNVGLVDSTEVKFTSIENLIGGIANDRFDFLTGYYPFYGGSVIGRLDGNVDGSGGADIIGFGQHQFVEVKLTGHGAVDGFDGIVSIKYFSITGTSPIGGSIFNINAVETDPGNFQPTTLVGLDGDSDWLLNDASQYVFANRAFGFSGIGHLMGGAGNDRFIASGNGYNFDGVHGNGGYNTLDFSAMATPQNLLFTSVQSPGVLGRVVAPNGSFSRMDRITGSATSTEDSITVQNISFYPAATWEFGQTIEYHVEGHVLELANYEVYRGSAGDDTFNVRSLAFDITLDGRIGDNTYNIGFGNLDAIQGKITIIDYTPTGLINTITLDDSQRTTPARYVIDAGSVTSQSLDGQARPFKGITYQGDIDNVVLHAGQGADALLVTPSATTAYTLNANAPAAGGVGRDYLEIEFAGTTGPQLQRNGGDGQWTFSNRKAVQFTGVEQFNYFPLLATGADAGGAPHVKLLAAHTREESKNFFAYDPGFLGGVRVALADMNGDGIPELITSAGKGDLTWVRIFDVTTTAQIAPTGTIGQALNAARASAIQGTLTFGDINGDGTVDVVAVEDRPGLPAIIQLFDGATGQRFAGALGSFMPYVPSYVGEVRIALGDVNGDNRLDIITAPGAGGGPHVKVFSGLDGGLLNELFAYNPSFVGGVYIAAGDLDGDGRADIITGAGSGGGPHVRGLRGLDSAPLRDFFAYNASFLGGVRVAAADVNGDGHADIITAAGPSGGPHVRIFSGLDEADLGQTFAYGLTFTGGVFVAAHAGTNAVPDVSVMTLSSESSAGAPSLSVIAGPAVPDTANTVLSEQKRLTSAIDEVASMIARDEIAWLTDLELEIPVKLPG